MDFLKKVAQGLAIELTERFGINVSIAVSMYYDLYNPEPPKRDEPFNAVALSFEDVTILVAEKWIIMTIASEQAKPYHFDKIEGLENVSMSLVLDRGEPKRWQFEICDPAAIDRILNEVENWQKNSMLPSDGSQESTTTKEVKNCSIRLGKSTNN